MPVLTEDLTHLPMTWSFLEGKNTFCVEVRQTRASEDKSAKLNSFYVQPLEQFPGSLNSVTKEGHISLLVATQQN